MTRILQILLTLILGLLLSAPTLATTVLPISLERMSKKAELIFYGTVISNEVKIDEVSGHVATFTTFDVIDVIKGNVGDTHTIKQIGGQLPDSKIMYKIHGVPRFTIGEKVVVFMPQESKLGFASPLGLSQGRFTVREQNGVSTVNDSRATQAARATSARDLKTPGTESSPQQRTSTSLAEFLRTVRELTAK
jgi:hypothetical protein